MSRDFTPPDFSDLGRDLSDSDARPVEPPTPDRDRDERTTPTRTPTRTSERTPEDPRPEIQFRDGRGVLYDRDRGYRLNESEIRTIVELGKFRVIAAHDLSQHA